jgi:hypothetical protein
MAKALINQRPIAFSGEGLDGRSALLALPDMRAEVLTAEKKIAQCHWGQIFIER